MSETVTIHIDRDEWYPVYAINKEPSPYTATREVPAALVERYEKALAEWDAVQDELGGIFTGD